MTLCKACFADADRHTEPAYERMEMERPGGGANARLSKIQHRILDLLALRGRMEPARVGEALRLSEDALEAETTALRGLKLIEIVDKHGKRFLAPLGES